MFSAISRADILPCMGWAKFKVNLTGFETFVYMGNGSRYYFVLEQDEPLAQSAWKRREKILNRVQSLKPGAALMVAIQKELAGTGRWRCIRLDESDVL